MKTIDLRSDTVTLPTDAMRKAMAEASLGDDVFGEDPTVNHLEALAADRVGMESALFVPSGTMANLISVLTHCGRGDEALVGNLSHTFIYEAGGMAAVGGVHPFPLPNQTDGTMRLDDIRAAIRADNVHFPRTRLICLENTHNRCEGAALPPEYMRSVLQVVRQQSIRVHVDGARIFNAAIALGTDVREMVVGIDSLSFCLSKGLGAPAGSLICGRKDFIREARRKRKMLGGGMRQAGVLAAAGIVAIEHMVDRLLDDHVNAQRLAEGIRSIRGLTLLTDRPQTNMVYAELCDERLDASRLIAEAAQQGLRFLATAPRCFRFVTHVGIETADVDTTVHILTRTIQSLLDASR